MLIGQFMVPLVEEEAEVIVQEQLEFQLEPMSC